MNGNLLTFEKLFNEMDSIFKPLHESHSPFNFLSNTYDVTERAESYLIEMFLPGYKKENIKVEQENDLLTISHEAKDENKFYKHIKSFSKSFRLPKNVNLDNISAVMEDGILKISIPKQEEIKSPSRFIEVQ